MNIVLTILLIMSSVFAEVSQDTFFLQQRGSMLSQLQYEMNLDLMALDPDNCRVPVKRADIARTLRRNIQELESTGMLSACRTRRFIGRRKIVQDLRTQRVAVEEILTYATPNQGITPTSVTTTEPVPEVPETKEILDPVDNSYLREPDPAPNYGSNPSPFDIYPGYEGLPYMSKSGVDDTISYTSPTPYDPSRFSSREMPPGLTLLTSGNVVGVPRKSGLFSPVIRAGSYLRRSVFKGPVKFKILPKPQFTILDPVQAYYSGAGFRADYPPFLKVRFKDKTDGVRTMHGTSTGKIYFEVKVLELGTTGAIGLDTLNRVFGGGAISDSGKYGFEFRQSYQDFSQINKSSFRKIQKGDILMAAYDASTAKFWIGVNGSWLKPGPMDVSDPAKGTGSYYTPEELARVSKIVPGRFVRPFVQGGQGTELVTNFGDQPWTYGPPDGFSGIRITDLDKNFPNLWDSNTSSASAGVADQGFPGTEAQSLDIFVLNSGGDAILGMSPKSTGRWQFEMASYSWAERSSMGIAPVTFDVDKLVKLGAAGTNSVGVRRQVAFARGPGVVDVNGKSYYIGDKDSNFALPSDTRFTFDCDFDKKTITIYADGKEIHSSALPEHSGAWAIAATMASTNASLFTQLPGKGIVPTTEMKYPVPGVKPWTLDDSHCPNCSTRTPVLTETKPVECPETSFTATGEVTNGNGEVRSCSMPATQAGMSGQCIVPAKFFACTPSGNHFFCSHYMDAYDTEERCKSECRDPESVVRKECSSTGAWK